MYADITTERYVGALAAANYLAKKKPNIYSLTNIENKRWNLYRSKIVLDTNELDWDLCCCFSQVDGWELFYKRPL